jgi:23S rRNA (guanosine2251-2'-O)-methyltransferase
MITLEGALSIKAALKYHRRKVEVVYLDETKKDTKDLSYIEGLCLREGVFFKRLPKEELQAMTIGHTHGGLIAMVEDRQVSSLESVIKKDRGFILLLEGIEDPFNLGQIFRTAAIAGVDAILMSKRDLESSQATLMKSSAGSFDAIDLVMVEDLTFAIDSLKKNKYIFAVTYRNETSIDYLDFDFKQNILLGIGGEMRGLSSSVMAKMDKAVMISYPTDLKVALNAVSASAVLCFEVVRQRR